MKQFKIKAIKPETFQLFGICSPEKIFTLCWNINHHLKFNFKQIEEHCVLGNNGVKSCFQLYKNAFDRENFTAYIVKNKEGAAFLSQQYRICDFLFVVYGDLDVQDFQSIHSNIHSLNQVTTTVEIPYKTLRQKQRFQLQQSL